MQIAVDILEYDQVEYSKHYHKKPTSVKKADAYLINVFRDAADGKNYGFVILRDGKLERLPMDQLRVVDPIYLA